MRARELLRRVVHEGLREAVDGSPSAEFFEALTTAIATRAAVETFNDLICYPPRYIRQRAADILLEVIIEVEQERKR